MRDRVLEQRVARAHVQRNGKARTPRLLEKRCETLALLCQVLTCCQEMLVALFPVTALGNPKLGSLDAAMSLDSRGDATGASLRWLL
ncbi:hypothetical protein PI125_g3279 [Phytophthora idaei]|nr:hypothetical protein PI125_g3279 [Phytophthora idaei]